MAGNDPYAATEAFGGEPNASQAEVAPTLPEIRCATHPERIGRYCIERVLGKGGFGVVYLAHDEQLHRPVAVKVPHHELISQPEDADVYLAEARTVANLDHPHIVPVHDVGRTDEFPCYVVSKYVAGSSLSTQIKENRPSYSEATELVATVAGALHYAHKHGVVHRDVKPGNILISSDGKAWVVDFGLAIQEENIGKGPRYVGTAAYMSPEQARGESHRVDGRSDIYSLGAVFYELLTGRRTFAGETKTDILNQIASQEPKPPRQIDDQIPKELERICLKALSKRASDRYTTALDMAEDLQVFLTEHFAPRCSNAKAVSGAPPLTDSTPVPADSDSQPIRIVPKGLRPFDERDADFFLELLPGPRDREGLPDSLRFWKTRIEEIDADETFSIGLIYGPSGCGKSSLVKAGLLPRLSEHVISIYTEATPDETETRLLHGLRKRCPAVKDNKNLKETMASLRRGVGIGPGRKVLIVLDQFEQWLHATKEARNTELLQALRHCDGGRVQCVVTVRDDFWLSVSRFVRELEVRLVEGHNVALADLFDLDHARKVLAAFGRAFGRLPENVGATTREQRDFLNQSVAGLADEGKVVCVRLALFAEMMKAKVWTPTSLKQVGGTSGVGVTFLEETFCSSTASPEHRVHQNAARAVLKALLPDSGTDIKGEMKPYDELLEASGYASQRQDFDDVLKILDNELRLVTPTDPAAVEAGDREPVPPESGSLEPHPPAHKGGSSCYYQLTHDYLVHSLRNWLTRKQRETRAGRTELQLAARTTLWSARREARQLPSLLEYLTIWWFVRPSRRSAQQRQLMLAAGRWHARRLIWITAAVTVCMIAGLAVSHRLDRGRRDDEARQFVDQVLVAELSNLPNIMDSSSVDRELIYDRLRNLAHDSQRDVRERLRAHLVLAKRYPESVAFIVEQVPHAEFRDIPVLRDALKVSSTLAIRILWNAIQAEDVEDAELLRLGACLACYAPQSPYWRSISDRMSVALVSANQFEIGEWANAMQPSASWLVSPLETQFRNANLPLSKRNRAAALLARFAADAPDQLSDWIMDADVEQFSILLAPLSAHRDKAVHHLKNRLLPGDGQRDREVERRARAALALMHLGRADIVFSLLEASSYPDLRSALISSMEPFGVPPETLIECLESPHPPSVRSALLLALGEYALSGKGSINRDIERIVTRLYLLDPDGGVHSAAEWLMHRCGIETPVSPDSQAAHGLADWRINSQGHTMIALQGPIVFTMGSPETETARDPIETQHERQINHSFAISAHEVTIEQFLRFDAGFQYARDVGESVDCPINKTNWFDAIRYCRWLSEQEHVSESEMCYPTVDDINRLEQQVEREGAKIDENLTDDLLSRTGYRLPTEAEWEYAARGGAATAWHFGRDDARLPYYCKYLFNADEHTWPVLTLRPNSFGLFGVHGNVQEWCHSQTEEVPASDELATALGSGADVRPRERLVRGGYYRAMTRLTRSAKRFSYPPRTRVSFMGFRVVRTLSVESN